MSRDESCRQTVTWSMLAWIMNKWEYIIYSLESRSAWDYLQHSQHGFQLVFSEGYVGGYFSQHVDGLQPHFLDLVVEHVDQEVQTLFGKAGGRASKLGQRLHCRNTDLLSNVRGGESTSGGKAWKYDISKNPRLRDENKLHHASLTKHLVLQAVNKGPAGPWGDEVDGVCVQFLLRSVVGPLPARGELSRREEFLGPFVGCVLPLEHRNRNVSGDVHVNVVKYKLWANFRYSLWDSTSASYPTFAPESEGWPAVSSPDTSEKSQQVHLSL